MPQALYKITNKEGFNRHGIWKGIEASMMREGSYSTIRIGTYEPFKRLLGATDPKTTPLWKNFLAGSMGGMIGSLVSNPADLIKTRMQAQPPGENNGIKWHARDIY